MHYPMANSGRLLSPCERQLSQLLRSEPDIRLSASLGHTRMGKQTDRIWERKISARRSDLGRFRQVQNAVSWDIPAFPMPQDESQLLPEADIWPRATQGGGRLQLE